MFARDIYVLVRVHSGTRAPVSTIVEQSTFIQHVTGPRRDKIRRPRISREYVHFHCTHHVYIRDPWASYMYHHVHIRDAC